MSGQIHDIGSVLSFIKVQDNSVQWTTRGGDEHERPMVGYGVVCVRRDGWAVTTRVMPMVMCCGAVVTTEHLVDEHDADDRSFGVSESSRNREENDSV